MIVLAAKIAVGRSTAPAEAEIARTSGLSLFAQMETKPDTEMSATVRSLQTFCILMHALLSPSDALR